MDPLCKYVTYTAIDKDDILASVSRRHLLIIMCVIIHECWNHETSGWGPGARTIGGNFGILCIRSDSHICSKWIIF